MFQESANRIADNVTVLDAVGHFTDQFSTLGLSARLPFKHLLSEVLNQNLKIKSMECIKCKSEIKFLEIHEKWKKSEDGFIKHKCKNCKTTNNITQDIQGKLHTY